MNRSLEEILNTPVEFKDGMRVFDFVSQEWFELLKIGINTSATKGYEYRASVSSETYTIDGRWHSVMDKTRRLLTEQEAYELFPSLKPKVYEYQVLCKDSTGGFHITGKYYISKEDFLATSSMNIFSFVELYQPSKRELK